MYRGANEDAFTVYMELVRKMLQNGRVCISNSYCDNALQLQYNDRVHLIKYRQAFGIRPEQHVAAIDAVGWSLEEYEVIDAAVIKYDIFSLVRKVATLLL